MSSLRGCSVTTAGRCLFAKLAATAEPLTITRIVFGTGKMPEGSTNNDLIARTALLEPFAEGTGSRPIYENDVFSMVLQFRSDLNGGLQKTVWLNEYGVYAKDGDNDVLIIYANFGDYADSVPAYENGINTIRDYPISVVVGAAEDVKIDFTASAYLTSQDADDLLNACMRRAVGLKEIPFTIQPQDWQNTNTGRYPYTAAVSLPDVLETHLPAVFFDGDSLETAFTNGISPQVQIRDGGLCFSSQCAPTVAVSGVCRLWTPGIGGLTALPVAAVDRIGGIKASDSILIDADGTAHAITQLSAENFASEEDMEAMLNDVYGQ